jgi:hypothetical protein
MMITAQYRLYQIYIDKARLNEPQGLFVNMSRRIISTIRRELFNKSSSDSGEHLHT